VARLPKELSIPEPFTTSKQLPVFNGFRLEEREVSECTKVKTFASFHQTLDLTVVGSSFILFWHRANVGKWMPKTPFLHTIKQEQQKICRGLHSEQSGHAVFYIS
jgi:hypothetical protein